MRTSGRSAIVLLSVLTLVWFLGVGAWDASAVTFGGHEISFLGAAYDLGTNTTTFTYRVSAASTPDTLVKIYFWILELNLDCFGAGDIIEASESYQYVGPDQATGVYGIKFDQPYAPGEIRTVWFRMPGDLTITTVQIVLRAGCTHWRKETGGPECPGKPTPPPPSGEGRSPGYWGTQLAKYLGYNPGKLKEPNVESYAAQYGYSAQQAYDILNYGGTDMVAKLHRQVVAAKLSTAAGYLSGVDALLEEGQYMVAHPGEFTEQQLEEAKDLFESLHD